MIKIYLDSSDYSNLATGKFKARDTLEKFVHLVDSDQVIVPFSWVHLIEATHVDAASHDASVVRAKWIKDISRGWCFKYPDEIRYMEILKLLNRTRKTPDEYSISNKFEWYPKLYNHPEDIRKSFIRKIKEFIHSMDAPELMKARARKLLISGDKISRELFDHLGPARQEFLQELSTQYPLSKRFFEEEILLNNLCGKISDQELLDEFSVLFKDPESRSTKLGIMVNDLALSTAGA